MIAVTREPSGSRASRMGFSSLMSSPKTRRVGIEPVIGQDNGLGILEFRENLGLKGKIPLDGVALGGGQGGPVGNGLAGEHAHAGVLTGFRDGVVGFELLFLAAEVARGAGAEVVRECQEYFRPEALDQSAPRFSGQSRAQRADALSSDNRDAFGLAGKREELLVAAG